MSNEIRLNEAAVKDCKRLAERLTASVPRATDDEREQLKKLLDLIEQGFLEGWSLCADHLIETADLGVECHKLLQRWIGLVSEPQTDLEIAERASLLTVAKQSILTGANARREYGKEADFDIYKSASAIANWVHPAFQAIENVYPVVDCRPPLQV